MEILLIFYNTFSHYLFILIGFRSHLKQIIQFGYETSNFDNFNIFDFYQ